MQGIGSYARIRLAEIAAAIVTAPAKPDTILMLPPGAYEQGSPQRAEAERQQRMLLGGGVTSAPVDNSQSFGYKWPTSKGLAFDPVPDPWRRMSDDNGIAAARATEADLAYFNPPPIQPSRVKPAMAGLTSTAREDVRLGGWDGSATC